MQVILQIISRKQQVFSKTFLEILLWKAITQTISFQMDEH